MVEITNSELIKAVGHDPDNFILTVELHTGQRYEYQDVPEEVYEEFLAAPSKGAYFNRNIKGKYQHPVAA